MSSHMPNIQPFKGSSASSCHVFTCAGRKSPHVSREVRSRHPRLSVDQCRNRMGSVRVRYTRQDERSLQAEPSAIVPGLFSKKIVI